MHLLCLGRCGPEILSPSGEAPVCSLANTYCLGHQCRNRWSNQTDLLQPAVAVVDAAVAMVADAAAVATARYCCCWALGLHAATAVIHGTRPASLTIHAHQRCSFLLHVVVVLDTRCGCHYAATICLLLRAVLPGPRLTRLAQCCGHPAGAAPA